jgi:hypothetical protein
MAKYYRYNFNGELLVVKSFDELVTYSNYFIEYSLVRKGKKWGVVDTKNLNILIDFKYDRLDLDSSFNNSVVFIGWLDEKTYLIDVNGDDLVSGIYDKIYFKRNTDFGVSFKDNLSGIISIENKIIFEPEYTACQIIQQNLFLLQKEGIYFLGNEKREIINKIECQSILPVVQYTDKVGVLTYFTFKLKDKFGLLDANLNIIIPANYETLEVNKFGKIYAQIDRDDFELSNTGQVLNKLEHTLRYSTSFDSIKITDNNYNYIVNKDETYKSKRGILDNDYKLVLPFEYDWIDYTNGVWVVRKGRSEYILDKNYKLIPNSKFNKIGKFEEEGIACVQDENLKYKFVNQNAELFLNKKFDNVQLGSRSSLDYLFNNINTKHKSGLCGVSLNSKWGYVDLYGKLVIECKFDEITEFNSRNNAIVKYMGKWGVVDFEGKTIIDFNFENIIDYNLDLKLIVCRKNEFLGMMNFDNLELIPFSFTILHFNNTEIIYGYSKKQIAKRLPLQKQIEPILLLESKLLVKHNTLLHEDLLRVMVMAVVSGEEDNLSNRLYIIDIIRKDLKSATFISSYAGGGVWDECTFINEKEYNGEEGGFTIFDYVRDDEVVKGLVGDYICEIDDELDAYQYKSLKHFKNVGDEDLKLLYSVWYNDSVNYTEISKNDKKRFKKILKATGGIWWKDWNFKF